MVPPLRLVLCMLREGQGIHWGITGKVAPLLQVSELQAPEGQEEGAPVTSGPGEAIRKPSFQCSQTRSPGFKLLRHEDFHCRHLRPGKHYLVSEDRAGSCCHMEGLRFMVPSEAPPYCRRPL
jgi:hypothetical protein